jgi:hypothetical protein
VTGPRNGNVHVEGNTFTDNRIGATFRSGLIDLTGVSNVFNNGRVGLRFSPVEFTEWQFVLNGEGFDNVPVQMRSYLELVDDDAPGVSPAAQNPPDNFGGTIGAQIFNNQTQYFVQLRNGAFYNPGSPTWLNGLNSTYTANGQTITPSDTAGILTAEQLTFLEDRFWHWIDDAEVGRFWFGGLADAEIPQERILNTFDAFGALGGEVNVVLLGLPPLPGGGNPAPTNVADFLNNLTPNAGEETGNPADIEPAAGGDEPAAGETTATTAQNNSSCWADATASAVAGSTTTFSFSSVINQTTLAQATNCGNGQPQ